METGIERHYREEMERETQRKRQRMAELRLKLGSELVELERLEALFNQQQQGMAAQTYQYPSLTGMGGLLANMIGGSANYQLSRFMTNRTDPSS